MPSATSAELITVQQAQAILDAEPVSPRVVSVPLSQVRGMRLAEAIKADHDDPDFDKALMDGFAVRSADLKQIPTELKCVATVPAGVQMEKPVGPGEAMAIMTGAPLPAGADRVVPVEDTVKLPTDDGVSMLSRMESTGRVRIVRYNERSTNIAPRGSDCAAGTTVLPAGTVLGPAQLAVAASVGALQVKVFERPRVALLSTGDELVAFDQSPGPAQRRETSSLALRALLEKFGCEVTYLGVVCDDPQKIKDKIASALSYDALFITGGMSMGEHDYVPKILPELGVSLKITKLRIKPGKPFIYGKGERTHVFGLPGNPVSGFVCTLVLATRLLRRMAGDESTPRPIRAHLELPLERNGDREFYQPAIYDGVSVWPLRWKSSADIYTLAQANALIIRGAGDGPCEVGAAVSIVEIPS